MIPVLQVLDNQLRRTPVIVQVILAVVPFGVVLTLWEPSRHDALVGWVALVTIVGIVALLVRAFRRKNHDPWRLVARSVTGALPVVGAAVIVFVIADNWPILRPFAIIAGVYGGL